MPSDTSKIDQIIQYSLLAAGDKDNSYDRQLGPIHLIKYVYLADLSYARSNNGNSYTGINWQFYKFGPWSQTVNSRIEPALLAIHANKSQFPSDYEDKEDWVRWELRNDSLLNEKQRALPPVITRNLRQDIRTFGKDTPSLLDYVYKTKPMLSAAPNEYLDLSLVIEDKPLKSEDQQSLRMDSLSNKKKKEFSQKMADLRKQHQQRKSTKPKLINPVKNPRYDKVYEEGVAWLESLSGDQFSAGEFSAEFSGEVWKSSTRKGNDVS